jgi:hypothetical protein
MNDLSSLFVLLFLGAILVTWLRLSVARERAVLEARRQCSHHGLQLLDETVGLRGIRLRRVNGLRRIERCYSFEVSIDGNDREPGRLWMLDTSLTSLTLPTVELLPPPEREDAKRAAINAPAIDASGKVVQLYPRPRLDDHSR